MGYQQPLGYGMPPGYQPPPGYMQPVPTGPMLASFGRRVGALIIDSFVIGSVSVVVGALANVPGLAQTTTLTSSNTGTTYMLANSGWSSLLVAIVSGLYCIGGWLVWSGTPAQRLLGIHVYRFTGPQALAFEAAALRWVLLFGIGSVIGALAVVSPSLQGILGLGQLAWLVVLIVTTSQSPTKQGIHDRYAGSLVVRN
jgi:uncharacterized RDD family membrane protein YckC